MKFSGTITVQYDTPFSPFIAREWLEGLNWIAESGFDGAEICISNYDNVDVKKIKHELDVRGLGCSTISTGQSRGLEGISLLHEGRALKKAQDRMKQHIDAAALLGSKVTLGLLRGLGTSGQEQEEKKILACNLEPVFRYAEMNQITILLEGINRYETSLLNSSSDVMEFIENELKGTASANVLWDVFHANLEDADFFSAIDRMGARLQHVHIADSNRMFPGYGHIDFVKIMKYLKKSGFKEYVSFECLNLPNLDAVRNESKRFIKEMRQI